MGRGLGDTHGKGTNGGGGAAVQGWAQGSPGLRVSMGAQDWGLLDLGCLGLGDPGAGVTPGCLEMGIPGCGGVWGWGHPWVPGDGDPWVGGCLGLGSPLGAWRWGSLGGGVSGAGVTPGCLEMGIPGCGGVWGWGHPWVPGDGDPYAWECSGIGGTHGCPALRVRAWGSWGWGHPRVTGAARPRVGSHSPEGTPGGGEVTTGTHGCCGRRQVLQTGRFSAVWRGTLQQRPVAIKAFVAGAAGRFAAERAVHGLPLMEHDNVARLLGTRGAGPRARGGLLVLQLYPAGSLRHFLEQHVGTWAGSVRLALSLARGLAFLHQELWRDGLYKPSVVHRDLSSQNVLVREDGTCAIGDFGLALALPPRAQAALPWCTCMRGPGASLTLAGTQRYLAPEILDESLDLRAWGRALRQADVYALALLLWEILSRCQALSPAPVPAFRLAYEAELGASPTGAQLRRLAVEERRRPLIPPAWHRAPQPVGALPELLEDCWDPDPEARLSAERALQRLQRLAAGPPPPSHPAPPNPPCALPAPPTSPCTPRSSLCTPKSSLHPQILPASPLHPQIPPAAPLHPQIPPALRLHPPLPLCTPRSPRAPPNPPCSPYAPPQSPLHSPIPPLHPQIP
uniref:receptor protein serine/threonine kinase n=1 Tax=Aquila chrysaetos chrysaetos TaxID=223781 RepID=A0A663EQG9_AQUCH